MSTLKPFQTTATEIAAAVAQKKLSRDEVLSFYSERAEKNHKKLNAFTWYDAKKTHPSAKQKTERLAGVPIVVKDNIMVEGLPTTCGSKILAGFTSTYDATAIARLKEHGAVIFAKANCDEFAMGSTNENSAFGAVKNPWDLAKVPGGSSGGSAASVAADLAPVALGSDTGGSIRQPAAFCGIVGVKPTYGRVSRYGLVAYGSSLDQIGPMTKTTLDAALVLDCMSGHDPKDSTSEKMPPTTLYETLKKLDPAQKKPLAGMKIGLIKEFFQEGLSAAVRAEVNAAAELYKELGATLREVSLPSVKYSIAAYYVIATAEASANLARFDGVRYGFRDKTASSLSDLYQRSRSQGFGREVKQRIMLGTFVLSSGYYDQYYGKAISFRKAMAKEFSHAFSEVDLLLSPTAPTEAYGIGEKISDPLAMYLGDICTIAANLLGVPALSIPCGYTKAGLPVGMQLMAKKFAEETLFKGAYFYESATGWRQKRTPTC